MTTPPQIIAALTRRDIPEVLAVEQGTPSPWTEAMLQGEFIDKYGWQFIGRLDPKGTITGYICGKAIDAEAEIYRLAVAAPFRRQGYGSGLLEYALNHMALRGIIKFFLELRASNTPALLLYEKFGFTRTGMRKNYYADPIEDAILMTKEIT